MPSPFPGVDPFLESQNFWPDFHARFVTYWCDALADRLPAEYVARIDERFSLIGPDENERHLKPGVAVVHGVGNGTQPDLGAIGLATMTPVTIPLLMLEETRETFIKVFLPA